MAKPGTTYKTTFQRRSCLIYILDLGSADAVAISWDATFSRHHSCHELSLFSQLHRFSPSCQRIVAFCCGIFIILDNSSLICNNRISRAV